MKLEECTTVEGCFMWADSQWPNFWEFANQDFLTKREIVQLARLIENDDEKFYNFMERLEKVAKESDISREAKDLLIKGAGAFVRLERRYNELANFDRTT